MATVKVIDGNLPQAGRVTRSPRHHYDICHLPYQIAPFMIAPVLPGETLTNLLLQGRFRSSGLTSYGSQVAYHDGLVGWWVEHYVFYVKHRDLTERDALVNMHLDPTADLSSLVGVANPMTYNGVEQIDWVQMCLERCVEEYFRDEGEAWDVRTYGGLPLASVNSDTWLDSAIIENLAADPGDEELPGEYTQLPPGVDPTYATYYKQWEHMRAMQVTSATFEDYLKSFGVKAPAQIREEIHRPELLRYMRDWMYPKYDANQGYFILQGDINERADKDRYFAEPGFIFGVTVARPKVYMGRQHSAAVSMLNNALAWLPAVLQNEPYTSLKKFLSTEGPLAGDEAVTGDNDMDGAYWVDLRDLFVHGDQFRNFSVREGVSGNSSEPGSHHFLMPGPGLGTSKRYCSDNDLLRLMADWETATFPEMGIAQEGVASLSVKTRITDTSL